MHSLFTLVRFISLKVRCEVLCSYSSRFITNESNFLKATATAAAKGNLKHCFYFANTSTYEWKEKGGKGEMIAKQSNYTLDRNEREIIVFALN